MDDDVLLPAEHKCLRGPYREYYITKRRNYLTVVRDLPELWDCFLKLDEIWARDLDNMRVVTQSERPPLIAMFRHSHQQFRMAFELGFSTAITEAWSIMRGSIDSAMVAHRIFREPKLLTVWVQKDNSRAATRNYKEAFKSANLFAAQYGFSELKSFYAEHSELGTHPAPGAVSMHTKVKITATGGDWNHTYLETDGKRTAAFLFRMLQASTLVENACFICFEDRLRLDSQLTDMRSRFLECKKHTAWIINNQILNA